MRASFIAPGAGSVPVPRSLIYFEGLMRVFDRMRIGLRKRTAGVFDSVFVGGSVDIRARRAHEATERAREAEERAAQAGNESKALAEHAREVSEHGRARLAAVDVETSREVDHRLAEARRAAEEFVRREREEAESDAQERRTEVEVDVENEIAQAANEADASRQRAEALVEDAMQAMAEARRLTDEAAEAARSDADEANRRAQQLENDAKQQSDKAATSVRLADELRERASLTAKQKARKLGRTDGLSRYRKPELVELAGAIGIENRRSMTKGELIEAITKAARPRSTTAARRQGR
jgi:hypothetical protein